MKVRNYPAVLQTFLSYAFSGTVAQASKPASEPALIAILARKEPGASRSAELPLRSVALTLIELLLFIALTFTTSVWSVGQTLTPSHQLQEAIHLMETKGDYAGAIKLLDAVGQGTDRALAARALLHLGYCYEKLGNVIARRKYQQLIDEYSGVQNADVQKLIAQARNRLVALDTALPSRQSDIVYRRVWTEGSGVLAMAASPDGRYLAMSFPKQGDSPLHLFEVATGQRQIITKPTPEDEEVESGCLAAIFSPDSQQIAYTWDSKEGYELRIIGIDGTNQRRLYKNERVDYGYPVDWSRDGRSLLTILFTKVNRSAGLALLDVADGSERVLQTFVGPMAERPAFSPDGRYVVYDMPQSEESSNHDIYLLDIDNGQVTSLIENPAHDFVLGWASDGKRFLFASDRTGNIDAWLVNVVEGTSQGQPQLIRRDIGGISPIVLTPSGALFYGAQASMVDVWIATLDPRTGMILTQPKVASQSFVGSKRSGAWSRDGRSFAYLSGRGRHFGGAWWWRMPFLVVRTSDANAEEERVLAPKMNFLNHLRLSWAPDGRSILMTGHDRKEQMGVYQVDAQTGAVTLIHTEPHTWFYQAQWSPDGKSIYFNTTEDLNKTSHLQALDLETRRVRDLFLTDLKESKIWRFDLSPDGRQIVFQQIFVNREGERDRMKIIPADSGERISAQRELRATGSAELLLRREARDVYVFPKGETSIDVVWTADGRHILFNTIGGEHEDTLWRISAEGGEPENLGLKLGRIPSIQCHPDGRQIAFTAGTGKIEVWVMENFLPPLKVTQRGER